MAKLILFSAIVTVLLSLHQCEAIKCYFCLEACEVSKAQEKTCGATISNSQEAVCTTEITKDNKDSNAAIRKCQIVTKGSEPTCPASSECTSCKSDLCNAAPSVGSNTALVGIFVALLATKLFSN